MQPTSEYIPDYQWQHDALCSHHIYCPYPLVIVCLVISFLTSEFFLLCCGNSSIRGNGSKCSERLLILSSFFPFSALSFSLVNINPRSPFLPSFLSLDTESMHVNYEVERHNKQVNYTQDSSFFSRKKEELPLGGDSTLPRHSSMHYHHLPAMSKPNFAYIHT